MVAGGSVWPWDTYISWPLLNAIYIWSKVYSGAVIVLHDRLGSAWKQEMLLGKYSSSNRVRVEA
jgi:hypothetical protein